MRFEGGDWKIGEPLSLYSMFVHTFCHHVKFSGNTAALRQSSQFPWDVFRLAKRQVGPSLIENALV